MVHHRVYFALVKSKLYCLIKIECMMNNLVSIAIFSVGFFWPVRAHAIRRRLPVALCMQTL